MSHDESQHGPYEPWPPPQEPWDAATVIRGPQVPAPRQPESPPAQTWARPPQAWPIPPQQQAWPPQPPHGAPPQQWAPGPPPGWPPPPKKSNTTLFVVLGVVLLVLLAGGGVGFYLWQRSGTPTRSAAATTASPKVAVGSAPTAGTTRARGVVPPPAQNPPATESAQTAEQAALQKLQELRADSLARVRLDGRWVAQIASKSVGITDPLQTASNGTHTFFAVDILVESLAARSTVDDPSEVYVLWGTDFGKRSAAADGSPYWVTLVDAGFSSSDAVRAWCSATYPTLSPQLLADTCVPRRLTPPHD